MKIPTALRAVVAVRNQSISNTDHLAYYSGVLGFDPSIVKGDEAQARCPFHDDSKPSLSVNVKTGKWKCYAGKCGLGGDRELFEKYIKEGGGRGVSIELTPTMVQDQHEILMRSDGPLKYVKDIRGISETAIKKHKIGFDGERILVPILKDGQPINFRRFRRPGQGGDKVLNMKGHGAAAIFPEEVLKENIEILLCEGEWDALVAIDNGFNAVTLTGGAGTFPTDLAEYFLGKDVIIAYDCDAAGRKGAKEAAAKLARKAKRVRILDLELSNGQDISDWFLKVGQSAKDLQDKMAKASDYKAAGIINQKQEIPADVLSVHLSEVGSGKFTYHRVRMTIHIAGKDTAPYVVPGEIQWDCEMGEKLCSVCNLATQNGQMLTRIDETLPDELLEMVNSPRVMVEKIIRRASGVPEKCPRPTMIIQKFYNIEIVRAIPDLDFAYEGRTYTIRTMFYRGHGIQPNHTYDVEGIALPDPNTQTATVVVYELKESEDTLSQFNVSPDFLEQQKIFQVA